MTTRRLVLVAVTSMEALALFALASCRSSLSFEEPSRQEGGSSDGSSVDVAPDGTVEGGVSGEAGISPGDAGSDGDAQQDVDAAKAWNDSGACVVQQDGTCGPDDLCCPPLEGFRYRASDSCKETNVTPIACVQRRPSPGSPCESGQTAGCAMDGGEVYYLPVGNGPLPGWDACDGVTRYEVMQAPFCGK